MEVVAPRVRKIAPMETGTPDDYEFGKLTLNG